MIQIFHLVVSVLSMALFKEEMQPGMCKEGRGPSFHKKVPNSVLKVSANKNTAEELTGQRDTDLRTMLSAQPAEFHGLSVCQSCQAEELGYRARERSGEQHGSFGERGDVQRVCGRGR